MVWLSHHHFEGLRERIFDSDELQRELTALIQQDLSLLGFRLDTIAGVNCPAWRFPGEKVIRPGSCFELSLVVSRR